MSRLLLPLFLPQVIVLGQGPLSPRLRQVANVPRQGPLPPRLRQVVCVIFQRLPLGLREVFRRLQDRLTQNELSLLRLQGMIHRPADRLAQEELPLPRL